MGAEYTPHLNQSLVLPNPVSFTDPVKNLHPHPPIPCQNLYRLVCLPSLIGSHTNEATIPPTHDVHRWVLGRKPSLALTAWQDDATASSPSGVGSFAPLSHFVFTVTILGTRLECVGIHNGEWIG